MYQEWWGKLFLGHEICLREIKTNKYFPPSPFSFFFSILHIFKNTHV